MCWLGLSNVIICNPKETGVANKMQYSAVQLVKNLSVYSLVRQRRKVGRFGEEQPLMGGCSM